MRYCEFQNKEVINVATGTCLGYVCDIEFEESSGCICSIIIPGPGKICGVLGREGYYSIDYCHIVRIGPELILVNVCDLKLERK